MAPGYQGTRSEDPFPHKRDALSGSEFEPGVESHDEEADGELKKKILSKLYGHTEIDSSHVKVAAKSGLISLSGHINSEDAKRTLEAIVNNVEGVQDVVNLIQIDEAIDSGNGNGLHHVP